MTRVELSRSASSSTSASEPVVVRPRTSVSRTSRLTTCATSSTVPSSADTSSPSHSRWVSRTTSVRKFCERTARFSSPSRTNSKALGVSSREPASKNESVAMCGGQLRRSSRRLVEPVFLNLVKESLVADAQDLGGFFAVPPRPGEHAEDQLALGLASSGARDVLERYAAISRRRERRR